MSQKRVSYLIIICRIISCDKISYRKIWYYMISYGINDTIANHMISYDITSYHMIWHHIISYHAATATSRCNGGPVFFRNFTLKQLHLKSIKIQTISAKTICTFSILNHCKISLLEPNSTIFCLQHIISKLHHATSIFLSGNQLTKNVFFWPDILTAARYCFSPPSRREGGFFNRFSNYKFARPCRVAC